MSELLLEGNSHGTGKINKENEFLQEFISY